MKIRYYLRGLGLGVLVTSIFFMVSGKSSQTMSDEMIKARAKELGMTESMVLAELSTEETVVDETEAETVMEESLVTPEETLEETSVEETVVEETTIEDVSAEEVTTEEVATEEVAQEETAIEETTAQETPVQSETAQEEPESKASNTEPVTIVVNRGNGSDTVSKRLQEAGLVADAYEYDKYLMANGYDKRIGAGEHVIPAGATWEEIAKILCNMQ